MKHTRGFWILLVSLCCASSTHASEFLSDMISSDSNESTTAKQRAVNSQLKSELAQAQIELVRAQKQLNESEAQLRKVTGHCRQPGSQRGGANFSSTAGHHGEEKIVVEFPVGQITFRTELESSNTLLTKAKRANHIIISGFSDSSGSQAERNRASERRATSTKDYLVKNGISADKITARGLPDVFQASNSTPEGRKRNRCVEIEFLD